MSDCFVLSPRRSHVALLLLFGVAAISAAAQSAPEPLTVSAIFSDPTLTAEAPTGLSWAPDGTRLTYIDRDGNLASVNATGTSSVLLTREKLGGMQPAGLGEQDKDHRSRYDMGAYFWAPDSQHLLFDSNGELYLYTLKDGIGVSLGHSSPSGADPKFAPDGSAVSYIHDHDLYLRRLPYSQSAVRLTTTHDPAVLNGEVDWVYLEELETRSNYFWSPDSKSIAYLQMNDTAVTQYPITDWIPTHASVEMQRYPQAGDPNPNVRIGVVSTGSGHTAWMKVPLDAGNDYIPRFGWLDRRALWVETLTRDHKHRRIYFVDVATGAAHKVLEESDDKFLDQDYEVQISGSNLLWTSWRDGHRQIYVYRFNPQEPFAGELTLERQLTKGTGEVFAIASVDEKNKLVYYVSNEGAPRDRQLWSIHLDGTGQQQLSKTSGAHKPLFSPNSLLYADVYSNAQTPPSVAMCRMADGDCQTFSKTTPNTKYTYVKPVELTLKAEDGTPLYASLVLPAGHDAKASVPLINNPYGGPGAQTVENAWSPRTSLFDQLLAEHGFAVLHVDNRGMAGRGRDFAQACWHDFGPVQLKDQLSAMDQVLAQYPQLDPQRQGWWGWSWGGTFTLYAMTHTERFKAGVAVAPVTDWRNYDSIYTERYLGLPAQNGDLYKDLSVVNYADKLSGRLLLVHGTGDDNVHIANTVQFVQKLIDAHMPYDLQVYPRKTHSIAGTDARIHLFTRILAQFSAYLGEPPAPSHGQ